MAEGEVVTCNIAKYVFFVDRQKSAIILTTYVPVLVYPKFEV